MRKKNCNITPFVQSSPRLNKQTPRGNRTKVLQRSRTTARETDVQLDSHCYVFFSPRSSDLPSSLLTRFPRTPPHSIILVPPLPHSSLVLLPPLSSYLALYQHPPSSFPFSILPPTLLNTETPRSMDLPWISPRSPLRPMDTRLRVFPCFSSFASPVSPSSPHPCFSVTLRHLILLLSLIPYITIDFFSH